MAEILAQYKIYTIPETPLGSIESRNLENDFPINNPIDFHKDHRLNQRTLDSYIESMDILGLENPVEKITILPGCTKNGVHSPT